MTLIIVLAIKYAILIFLNKARRKKDILAKIEMMREYDIVEAHVPLCCI